MTEIKELSSSNDKHTKRMAAATLAELYDQTSSYSEAEKVILFEPDGFRAISELREAAETEYSRKHQQGTGSVTGGTNIAASSDRRPVMPEKEERRRRYRSMAAFCLAHAISMHRRTYDAGKSLTEARTLAMSIRESLKTLEKANFHFAGNQAFVAYWLGRIEMARGKILDAEQMFDEAIFYLRSNLKHHFDLHAAGSQPHEKDIHGRCGYCQGKIELANYLLASIMAFGRGLIKLRSGKINDALMLLRPALTLLENSSSDPYRRGYAYLLIGRCHRVLGGADAKKMKDAIDLFKKARELFDSGTTSPAAHRYYIALTEYQLILARLFIVKDKKESILRRRLAMLKAIDEYCQGVGASLAANQQISSRYADHDLQFKRLLLGSRIICELTRLHLNEDHTMVTKMLTSGLSSLRFADKLSAMLAPNVEFQQTLTPFERVTGLFRDAKAYLERANEEGNLLRESHRLSHVLAEADLAITYAAMIAKISAAPGGIAVGSSLTGATRFLDDVGQRLESLISTLHRRDSDNFKALASLEIAYARVRLSSGDLSSAHEHLDRGLALIRTGTVENGILKHDADELRNELPKSTGQIILSLSDNGVAAKVSSLMKQFHVKLAQAADEDGLSQQEAAERYDVDVKTIQNWCKNGAYKWIHLHSSKGSERRSGREQRDLL